MSNFELLKKIAKISERLVKHALTDEDAKNLIDLKQKEIDQNSIRSKYDSGVLPSLEPAPSGSATPSPELEFPSIGLKPSTFFPNTPSIPAGKKTQVVTKPSVSINYPLQVRLQTYAERTGFADKIFRDYTPDGIWGNKTQKAVQHIADKLNESPVEIGDNNGLKDMLDKFEIEFPNVVTKQAKLLNKINVFSQNIRPTPPTPETFAPKNFLLPMENVEQLRKNKRMKDTSVKDTNWLPNQPNGQSTPPTPQTFAPENFLPPIEVLKQLQKKPTTFPIIDTSLQATLDGAAKKAGFTQTIFSDGKWGPLTQQAVTFVAKHYNKPIPKQGDQAALRVLLDSLDEETKSDDFGSVGDPVNPFER